MVQHLDVGGLIVRDRVGEGHVIRGIAGRLLALPGADPQVFQRITLSPKRVGVLHGRCRFPKKPAAAGGYVITAAVRAEVAAFPAGIRHWGALADRQAKQGWRSGPVVFGFPTRSHATAFVLAHELLHVALHQKWLKRKNTEAMVNALALDWCRELGLPIQCAPLDRRARLVDPVGPLPADKQTTLLGWLNRLAS